MENSKVLILLESSFPGDPRVDNEVYTLRKAGYSITVLCIGKPFTGMIEGVSIIRRAMPKLIYKSKVAALKCPLYFAWWWLWVRKFQAGIVHVNDLPLAWVGIRLKQKRGVKFILDLHENYPALQDASPHTKTLLGRILFSRKQWNSYERKAVWAADEVITICYESLVRFPRHVWVVQNTFNIETAPEAIIARNTGKLLRIFYGGCLNYHRGLQDVLRAMKDAPGVMLVIAGEGSYKATLQELAYTELQLPVMFLGNLPFGAFINMLSSCHVGIIPHLHTENNEASSPNKLFQYMYYGLPVISSSIKSVSNIIHETHCGWVYEDQDQLREMLQTLSEKNQNFFIQKGRNGRKAVESWYNWNEDSKSLMKCYKQVSMSHQN